MSQRIYDLEERLVEFSSHIIDVVEGFAPALLYGEAQGAESRDDFIHKMKVGLKELKETRICLKLVTRRKMVTSLDVVSKENEELIAIIAKSIDTARRNKQPPGPI